MLYAAAAFIAIVVILFDAKTILVPSRVKFKSPGRWNHENQ